MTIQTKRTQTKNWTLLSANCETTLRKTHHKMQVPGGNAWDHSYRMNLRDFGYLQGWTPYSDDCQPKGCTEHENRRRQR